MIAVHPAIMGHSLETSIKPKIDFLVNVMNRTVNEIVSFPQYLSYSLCSRIQPRYEYLAKRSIYLISLSSMLSCRSDIFLKRYSSGYQPPEAAILAHKMRSKSKQC
jgi:mTERF domain-containing protein